MLKLLLRETQDEIARENFSRIAKELDNDIISSGNWRFIELAITGAVSNFRYEHNMGFKPLDVIVTSTIGGTVTFNFNLFSDTHIDITTSATATVRFFLGRVEV